MTEVGRVGGRRRRATAIVVCAALALGACGDDGDGDSDTTTTSAGSVADAQQQVDQAESDLDDAEDAFDAAREVFCGDSEALIETLDDYGRLLDDAQVTVGDVRTGAEDLGAGREVAGTAAAGVLGARDDVAAATEELAVAEAALAAAEAEEATGTTATAPPEEDTTTTTAPLVPEDVTGAVEDAEAELSETADGVTDETPVAEAGVRLGSAVFAVEIAWLQLFAEAGCLTDEEEADAIARTAELTRSLQTALQEAAGLPETGLADPATVRALDVAVEEARGEAQASDATYTAGVQGALKALGYWDGPVDGVWSDALTDAVTRLQTDLGIEATGIVDPPTLHALETALADVSTPEADDPSATTEETTTSADTSTSTAPAPSPTTAG